MRRERLKRTIGAVQNSTPPPKRSKVTNTRPPDLITRKLQYDFYALCIIVALNSKIRRTAQKVYLYFLRPQNVRTTWLGLVCINPALQMCTRDWSSCLPSHKHRWLSSSVVVAVSWRIARKRHHLFWNEERPGEYR